MVPASRALKGAKHRSHAVKSSLSWIVGDCQNLLLALVIIVLNDYGSLDLVYKPCFEDLCFIMHSRVVLARRKNGERQEAHGNFIVSFLPALLFFFPSSQHQIPAFVYGRWHSLSRRPLRAGEPNFGMHYTDPIVHSPSFTIVFCSILSAGEQSRPSR